MMPLLCRPEPMGPVQGYRTYALAAPTPTHFRPASCAEYECARWKTGFETVLDLATDLGQKLYKVVKNDKTRSYQEVRTGMYEVRFVFPPGTPCWENGKHLIPVGRPPVLIVRGGDWRASTGIIRRHSRVEFWVEDFALHQEKLARIWKG